MDASTHYSSSYAEARARFCAAARRSPALDRLWSAPFDARDAQGRPFEGREGEELATDFAWFGEATAPRVLILSSGAHGAEGLAGSGAQLATMETIPPLVASGGLAVLMIHALNPWGVSHGRRCDQNGVDLMRNFLDFSQPPPEPGPVLRRNVWALSPDAVRGPKRWFADARILWLVTRHGLGRLQSEIPMGQYAFADAPFYGGAEPSWARRTLETHLAGAVGRTRRAVAMIDLHTGLGARGVGVLLGEHEHREEPACRRGLAWWGAAYEPETPGDARPNRLQKRGERRTAYRLNGSMPRAIREQIFQDEGVVSTVLEFGTIPQLEALNAVRDDHAVWRRARAAGRAAPDPSDPDVIAARKAMRAAFYPDDAQWRAHVAAQTIDAISKAAAGLLEI